MTKTHTVEDGDTLSGIADRHYGDPGLYQFIATFNGISDSNRIAVGQVLMLPEVGRIHKVIAGDTLSKIAQSHYGDPNLFGVISAANGIPDPDNIEVGWSLVIPDQTDHHVGSTAVSPVMPYSSEPFGVYQPLIGWRSNLQKERVRSGIANRFQQAVSLAQIPASPSEGADGDGMSDTGMRPRYVDATGTKIGREFASLAQAAPGDPDVWRTLLTENAGLHSIRSGASEDREIATFRMLRELGGTEPAIFQELFSQDLQPWERALAGVRLLSQPHPSKEMFLSPIGILHRFRQYFFELGTFLGPPVGHVWLSPGGTVELVEVNTRRSLVERTLEKSFETIERSENSSTSQDEIADAVKIENSNDMKLGVSTSASGGFGSVFQAGASSSFNLASSRKQAQEQTHKRMREQTAKLSSEVKQNFKTTFRTVTETTDTSSRRYVLQNTTSRLVSYELSRKMRKVAVQVQDLGRQLCWQLFVDNPGNALDSGEFVHETASALDPSHAIPDRMPYPPDKAVTYSFAIPFLQHNGGHDDTDPVYVLSDENANHGVHKPSVGANNIIQFKFDIDIPPPPEGFQLKSIGSIDFKNEQVTFRVEDADLQPNPNIAENTFSLRLVKASFGGKRAIPFEVTMLYEATQALRESIDAKNLNSQSQYASSVAAEREKLFYETLRKRIKLSRQVQRRHAEDLREEERNTIYRSIIFRLYGSVAGWEREDYHVASELIRYFFDIDAMLYFVAPDWWRPRVQKLVAMSSGGQLQSTTLVSDGWKYLFTEESEPAPLGASLGWFMQLDGDANRNAFLNAPWVKAVLPIRPGREKDAMTFLSRPEVAGTDGLDEPYPFDESQDPPEYRDQTLRDVLIMIAERIATEHEQSMTPAPTRLGDPNSEMALPTEMVFANGFDPLAGGIAFGQEPFKVFSQWTEILPTEQVVATEYDLKNSVSHT